MLDYVKGWLGLKPSPKAIPEKLAKCLSAELVAEIEALAPDSQKRREITGLCMFLEQMLLQGQLDIAKTEAELRKKLNGNGGAQNDDGADDNNAPKKKNTCTTVSKRTVPQQQALQPHDGGLVLLQSTSMDANPAQLQLSQFELPKAEYDKTVAALLPTYSGTGAAGCKAVADIAESLQKTAREAVSQDGQTRRTFIENGTKRDIAVIEGEKFRIGKVAEVYKHKMDVFLKDREDARRLEYKDRQDARRHELELDPGHQEYTLRMEELKGKLSYRMEELAKNHVYRMEALKEKGVLTTEGPSAGGEQSKWSFVAVKKLEEQGKRKKCQQQQQQQAGDHAPPPVVEEPESSEDEEEQEQ